MTDFILCYLTLCLTINTILYVTKNFIGTRELKMISSLLIICVIVIPCVQDIPGIISEVDFPKLKTDVQIYDDEYSSFEKNITENIEVYVEQLIENKFQVKTEVSAVLNFENIEEIKLSEIRINTSNTDMKEEIYLLIKNTYFCEVIIYE